MQVLIAELGLQGAGLASGVKAKLSPTLSSEGGGGPSGLKGPFSGWAGTMPPILSGPALLFHLFHLLKKAGNIVGRSHPRSHSCWPLSRCDLRSASVVSAVEWGYRRLLWNGVTDAASLEDFREAHSR